MFNESISRETWGKHFYLEKVRAIFIKNIHAHDGNWKVKSENQVKPKITVRTNHIEKIKRVLLAARTKWKAKEESG